MGGNMEGMVPKEGRFRRIEGNFAHRELRERSGDLSIAAFKGLPIRCHLRLGALIELG